MRSSVEAPGANAPRVRRRAPHAVGEAEGASTAEDAYRAVAPAVLGYLRSIGATDPDDLLGEIFVQVTRSIGSFQGDAAQLRRWVFAVTRNCLVDDVRRRGRRPVVDHAIVPDREVHENQGPDPRLIEALAELTPEQREVIGLRFVADLPLEAVAELTGRPVGAVKSMQHRALTQLSRHLATEAGR